MGVWTKADDRWARAYDRRMAKVRKRVSAGTWMHLKKGDKWWSVRKKSKFVRELWATNGKKTLKRFKAQKDGYIPLHQSITKLINTKLDDQGWSWARGRRPANPKKKRKSKKRKSKKIRKRTRKTKRRRRS